MAIDDGGPAFPMMAVYDQEGRGIMEGASGMSLRDWFAGQTLAGMRLVGDVDVRVAAAAAYALADAMLAVRKAG